MLKFFRRGRRQLIDEDEGSEALTESTAKRVGRPKRYLMYGVGEIFLVVVGILIALQINNWNENKKTSRLEEKYLELLKKEFSYNLEQLEKVMGGNQKKGDRALELSQYTGPGQPQLSEAEFAGLFFSVVNEEVQYRPSNGVLEEILSSGKLTIFSDQSLRTYLSSWNGILFRVRFQEQELAKYRYALIDMMLAKINGRQAFYDYAKGIFDLTPSKFENNNLDLLQSVEFESVLVGFLATSRFAQQEYYPNLKVEIENILELIAVQLGAE
ncbi:MAG: hypothetical protein KTR30_30825 [Saprospiraceae bacterium]|nr:hypothetical protein [Saprospiraceae bacterium]